MNSLVSAINISLDAGQSWCVIKFGVYPNAVGLQVFDHSAAVAVQRAFNEKKSSRGDLFRGDPIYVGHPDDADWVRENPGVLAAAVGRIREMRISSAGLHLLPAYNDEGKRLVSGALPVYEAFSPNWGMVPTVYQGKNAFRPVVLHSIGLTNRPNIPGTSIGLNTLRPPDARSRSNAISLARISSINEAVTAKMTASGLPHHEAYAAVKRQNPSLFTNSFSQ